MAITTTRCLLLLFLFTTIWRASAEDMVPVLQRDLAAIAQAEKEHGPESREVADAAFSYLSHSEFADHETLEMLAVAKKAVAATRTAYGPTSPQYVRALVYHGNIAGSIGHWSEGERAAREALELARSLSPTDPHLLAKAAIELADQCSRLGDLASSLSLYTEAIHAEQSSAVPNPVALAEVLNNRAQLYSEIGRKDDAVADMRSSYAIVEKQPGVESPEYCYASGNLGDALTSAGQPQQAIPYLEQALNCFLKKEGGQSGVKAAVTRAKLGRALAGAGQFAAAWPMLQQAIDEYRTLVPKGHPRLASLLLAQARALAAGGDSSRALETALDAERERRQGYLLYARTLPERHALSYAFEYQRALDVALSVLSAEPQTPGGVVYQELIRSRALVADGMAWRNQELAQTRSADLKALAQVLADRRTEMAKLVFSEKGSSPDLNSRLARARTAMEDAETNLAFRSTAFKREQQELAINLHQVSEAIPPGAVLVSYVRYRQYAVGRVDPREESTESYAAFVQGRGASPRFVALGPAQRIDSLVESMRSLMETQAIAAAPVTRRAEGQYRMVARKLRQSIWDPLVAAIGDTARVSGSGSTSMIFIVPDGMLHFVSFESLPAKSGRYLVEEGIPIHWLSTERDLLSPLESGPPESGNGLLAVANPDFGPGSGTPSRMRGVKLSCGDIGNAQFSALPATLPEMQEVSRLFHEGDPQAPLVQLAGAAATKSGFLSQATAYSDLHVATHAFFVPSSCSAKAKAANPDAGISYENPLLRSGLIFSGNGSERVLTAQEISSLSLAGTDWVVLSACDTGMGELEEGEGVLGLQRAFRVAGARTVIMSLWPVDDDSTRQFMHNLYAGRFRRRLSTAQAMQQATLRTLQQMRAQGRSTHPLYWAGFVASGDWR
ncbi:MAG: CHAT domain-containing tetratricopeptide repeat protein [Terriglobales bacterium]